MEDGSSIDVKAFYSDFDLRGSPSRSLRLVRENGFDDILKTPSLYGLVAARMNFAAAY